MRYLFALYSALLAFSAMPAFAASEAVTQATVSSPSLTAETKAKVVQEVIRHLREEYVDPEVGRPAADRLARMFDEGRFSDARTGDAYAKALGAELQSLTGDGHLNVEHSPKAIALEAEADDGFSADEMEKYYGAKVNFGIQRIEHLDGNIGYLDLRVFAPIDMGGASVASAMSVLAPTSALIIDLRKNGGGIGDMADLVASYLFAEERQPLTGVYDRPTDTLTQRFTQPMVPGRRFGPDKPVYILMSKRTFSAAEALAYNLQALGRATIIGEVSGGGAHPFEYKPIHPHFVLWSVTAKSVNPVTGSNWQSVGVKPDIEIPADDALEEALRLARKRVASK